MSSHSIEASDSTEASDLLEAVNEENENASAVKNTSSITAAAAGTSSNASQDNSLLWSMDSARLLLTQHKLWPTFIGAKSMMKYESHNTLPVRLWPEQQRYLNEKETSESSRDWSKPVDKAMQLLNHNHSPSPVKKKDDNVDDNGRIINHKRKGIAHEGTEMERKKVKIDDPPSLWKTTSGYLGKVSEYFRPQAWSDWWNNVNHDSLENEKVLIHNRHQPQQQHHHRHHRHHAQHEEHSDEPHSLLKGIQHQANKDGTFINKLEGILRRQSPQPMTRNENQQQSTQRRFECDSAALSAAGKRPYGTGELLVDRTKRRKVDQPIDDSVRYIPPTSSSTATSSKTDFTGRSIGRIDETRKSALADKLQLSMLVPPPIPNKLKPGNKESESSVVADSSNSNKDQSHSAIVYRGKDVAVDIHKSLFSEILSKKATHLHHVSQSSDSSHELGNDASIREDIDSSSKKQQFKASLERLLQRSVSPTRTGPSSVNTDDDKFKSKAVTSNDTGLDGALISKDHDSSSAAGIKASATDRSSSSSCISKDIKDRICSLQQAVMRHNTASSGKSCLEGEQLKLINRPQASFLDQENSLIDKISSLKGADDVCNAENTKLSGDISDSRSNNDIEETRYKVFRALQEKQYMVGPGDVYGGDYSIYKGGDPTRTHASATVRVLHNNKISGKELLAFSRVQNQVAKSAVLGFVSSTSASHEDSTSSSIINKHEQNEEINDTIEGEHRSKQQLKGEMKDDVKFLAFNFKGVSRRGE